MADFQTIAAVVFLIILTIFVYLNRKRLDTKQIIPYVLYFSMYKTTWGLKLMDFFGRKYKKLVIYLISTLSLIGVLIIFAQVTSLAEAIAKYIGTYWGIYLLFVFIGIITIVFFIFVPLEYKMPSIGFLGMILISFALISSLYFIFTKPEATPGVGLVLPFKAKGVFFVPFFYWMISLFVIAVVHEFSHGLIARANNLKVKSSGFAFVGLIAPIIPAAFVEPDEKELRKRLHREQLNVFSSGPLSNVALGLIFFGIVAFILAPMANAIIEPNGVKVTDYVKEKVPFPAEISGIKIGEIIQQIDEHPVQYVDNLSMILKTKKPNEVVTIKTDKSSYEIKLAKNPENESLAYIGAYLEQSTKIKEEVSATYGKFLPNVLTWLFGLFVFLYILNFGIGLFNLVPIGPLDGGRMLQLVLHRIFDKEKGDKVWYYIGMFFLILIFINIAFAFVR